MFIVNAIAKLLPVLISSLTQHSAGIAMMSPVHEEEERESNSSNNDSPNTNNSRTFSALNSPNNNNNNDNISAQKSMNNTTFSALNSPNNGSKNENKHENSFDTVQLHTPVKKAEIDEANKAG